MRWLEHLSIAAGAFLALACSKSPPERAQVGDAAPPIVVGADDRRDDPDHDEYRACDGKTCGDRCTVCDPHDPDCVETAAIKACNPQGQCVPVKEAMCRAEHGQ